MAWCIYYIFASFATELPWASCGNQWNTHTCLDVAVAKEMSNVTSAFDGMIIKGVQGWIRETLMKGGGRCCSQLKSIYDKGAPMVLSHIQRPNGAPPYFDESMTSIGKFR